MNKTKVNYWVDLVIALAFVMSAVSGIVFLLPMNDSTILGIAYNIWDQIHIWGSLLMITGVLAHLVLHWKWIVAMTRKTFTAPAKPAPSVVRTGESLMSRRQFLQTAGLSAAALGVAVIGYKSLSGNNSSNEENLTDEVVAQSEAQSGSSIDVPVQNITTSTSVACHKGITYDAYPGKCHSYVDEDGDGYCDYSIPT